MIKHPSDTKLELRENARGGNGTVEFRHLFNEGEYRSKIDLIAVIKLDPGCSIGYHQHTGNEEIYYILSGKLFVNDNGLESEVSAGDYVLTTNEGSHSIENRSDEPGEFLAIVIPY